MGRGSALEEESNMPDLERLVAQACAGDRQALEDVVLAVQDRIYKLALRMLAHPADAEDAAQEILVKIVTRLESYRGESAFTTWAFSVAARHLLTVRRQRAELAALPFEEMEQRIDHGSAREWPRSLPEAQQGLVVEEIRLSCLQGLLLALDRDQRLVYLLTEVFDVTGAQGAHILNIDSAAYRKRLSRARARLNDFMLRCCSLINPDNPCQCRRQARSGLAEGWISPDRLRYVGAPCRAKYHPDALRRLAELDELQRVAVLFKTSPDFAAPDSLAAGIRAVVGSGRYELFSSTNTGPAPN